MSADHNAGSRAEAVIPESIPAGCRRASWRDYGSLLLIALSVQLLLVWSSLVLRWSMITAFALLAFMLILVALLDWRAALVLSAFVVGFCAGLTVVLLAGLNVIRLLDPRRVVLLSKDGSANVDAVFRRGKSISLRNHGRTLRARSAPAMRDAIRDWIRPLIGADFVIVAQNARVARLYIEQFPELTIIGRNWMGHPKLAVVDDVGTPT